MRVFRARLALSAALAALLTGWVGCATATSQPTVTAPLAAPAQSGVVASAQSEVALPETPEASDYRLRRGDVLEIKFFYNSELNERLPIRPDGKISLALVGEVQAAGRSAAELRRELTERYAVTLRHPEVAVIVKELTATKVFVGGEVRAAGVIQSQRELTLLQAIVQAGGFLPTAKVRTVVILRDQGTSEPLFMTVDLAGDLDGSQLGGDMKLQPDDIIFVPATRIAKVDQFVDQYIRQVIPVALNLGVSYLHGNTVRFGGN